MELTEIEDLAESIGRQYMVEGRVDLEGIAAFKKIPIIYGKYEDYFLGQIVHEDDQFFIYVNLDKLPDVNAPRVRFTIAHDLGHYFIDYHRNSLKKGISLAYRSSNSLPPKQKPKHETEADHFATHLLMPKTIFKNEAKKQEPGLDAILYLKKHFDTSIECTALHYVKLNILPCMLIRWQAGPLLHYSCYSDSLAKLTGLSGKPIIQVQNDYLQKMFMEIEFSDPKVEFIENVSPLSKWVATIAPSSTSDLIGIEQTFKLGEFGGITFLIFSPPF